MSLFIGLEYVGNIIVLYSSEITSFGVNNSLPIREVVWLALIFIGSVFLFIDEVVIVDFPSFFDITSAVL